MALTGSDLLVVQRGSQSYKCTATNLKSFINTGDTNGTVTQLTEGNGINLTPNVITDTGSIAINTHKNSSGQDISGLAFSNKRVYVRTDNVTIVRDVSQNGRLEVKKAPLADKATNADYATAAGTAAACTGNAATATLADKVNVRESNANAWYPVCWTNNDAIFETDGVHIQPKSDFVRATSFVGNLSGKADSAAIADRADKIDINATNTTNANYSVTFGSSGNNQTLRSDSTFFFNPATNTLTVPNITANVTGGSSKVNLTSRSTNASHYIPFSTGATGAQQLYTDNGIRYNPSINKITVGDINSTSDLQLKTNVTEIQSPLSILSQIRGINFTWRENGQNGIGVIAQEVEAVIPRLVDTIGTLEMETATYQDVKTVNYNGLVGLLIESVKELQAEVEALKTQLAT